MKYWIFREIYLWNSIQYNKDNQFKRRGVVKIYKLNLGNPKLLLNPQVNKNVNIVLQITGINKDDTSSQMQSHANIWSFRTRPPLGR